MKDARLAAGRLRVFGGLGRRYAVVVLCGRKVAAVFGMGRPDQPVPWTEEREGVKYLILPHPSGVSHFWNDEACWHLAACLFRAALQFAGLPVPPPRPRPLPALTSRIAEARKRCQKGSGICGRPPPHTTGGIIKKWQAKAKKAGRLVRS